MNQNIKIDFHGGTHGHFLEYIVNTYIFRTPKSEVSIFTPNRGSSHEASEAYQRSKQAVCGHFSDNAQGRDADPKYKNFKYSDNDKIVQVSIDQLDDKQFFIALTNLLHRTSGATFDQHMDQIPECIRNNRKLLRDNFYSKIQERETYCNLFPVFKQEALPTYKFNFNSFFSYTMLCAELNQLSIWLDKEFCPDSDLYMLWFEFISLNQGWNSYYRCDKLLTDILSNAPAEIKCTTLEEAWLNYNLTKMCNVYNGTMFSDNYPTNAQEIYKQIYD